MPNPTVGLASLPPAVHEALTEHAGMVREVRLCTLGRNNDFAAVVTTADGPRFVKASRADRPQSWTQDREAAVNPYALPHAPRLLHTARLGGWLINSFEVLTGPHADYRPGSQDLSLIVDMLTKRTAVTAPTDLDLPTMANRLADHDRRTHLLGGNALLHTDWNPANVLVTPEGVRLVDWAWASTGAPWIDTAAWCVWLINTGHHPQEAEAHATRVPAFANAPNEAVDTFAAATAVLWSAIARQRPIPWHRSIAAAAAAWATYRSS